MSNDPVAPSRGGMVRWIITGCLLVLAIVCVGWIVSLKLSAKDLGWGSPFVAEASLLPIAALDVLGLIGLGVWVLRPPAPGALGFFRRWLGVSLDGSEHPVLLLDGGRVDFLAATTEHAEGVAEIALELPSELRAGREAIELGGVHLRLSDAG